MIFLIIILVVLVSIIFAFSVKLRREWARSRAKLHDRATQTIKTYSTREK
ncbi:hypothetical protein FLK61_33505 [Paenalkalicoccus suaedae]|uniref:Uncharacterized protein n=1 Tax=Paenalkalicoccus suaedae TaxID=2592382 RepID=A0A859FHE6_9BACI|nr:hypothetical protein FLK61_33505 [Paenalkalicoccus suaedae]